MKSKWNGLVESWGGFGIGFDVDVDVGFDVDVGVDVVGSRDGSGSASSFAFAFLVFEMRDLSLPSRMLMEMSGFDVKMVFGSGASAFIIMCPRSLMASSAL